MNTIAAQTSRIPRVGLIVIVALIVAFALLMIVRVGVLGGSSESSVVTTPPKAASTPTTPSKSITPAKPTVVLLPGLPTTIAAKLRRSRVVVVSVYLASAVGDRSAVAAARKGARSTGAGFAAVNVANNKNATQMNDFVGPVSSPTMLVVRRPGTVVTKMSGMLDSAIVAQAAHNAGARRR